MTTGFTNESINYESTNDVDDNDGHSTEGHPHMLMVAVIRYAQIGLGGLAVCMFCALICHLCWPCVALREKWRDCLKKAEDAADAISALREARRARRHALLASPRPQTADLLDALVPAANSPCRSGH